MATFFRRKRQEVKNSFVNIEKIKALSRAPALKIAARSLLAFCAGAIAVTLSLALSKKAGSRAGMGGLETEGVPIVTEDTLRSLDAQAQGLDDDLSLSYQTYRVKSGDMIGFIAQEHGITQDTIISVNGIRASRRMQVGQYIKIPSIPGILYTSRAGDTVESIARKFDIDPGKCAMVNSLGPDEALAEGVSLFLPDAKLSRAALGEINGDLFKRPLHAAYYLSSYYGYRDSPFTGRRARHSGIDMAAPKGTAIFPACDGKVVQTGYNSTYGNFVIIRHFNGYKTLYGHMNAILCKAGNYVYTNTIIGRVGSTGMSTGPHLHFTVYKNGATINPLNVLN